MVSNHWKIWSLKVHPILNLYLKQALLIEIQWSFPLSSLCVFLEINILHFRVCIFSCQEVVKVEKQNAAHSGPKMYDYILPLGFIISKNSSATFEKLSGKGFEPWIQNLNVFTQQSLEPCLSIKTLFAGILRYSRRKFYLLYLYVRLEMLDKTFFCFEFACVWTIAALKFTTIAKLKAFMFDWFRF